MLKKHVLLNILIAFSIFLPTIAGLSIAFYLVPMGLGLFFNRKFILDYIKNLSKLKIIDRNLTFILLLTVCIVALRLVDYPNWESKADFYSFVYLFPFTYFVAKMVDEKRSILKYLVYFISIEAVISLVEYALGQSTIFYGIETYREFESYDLLYFTRVFGLSFNSSTFSLKLIFAIIILPLIDFKSKQRLIIEIILVLGSIVAFSRIALFVLIIYYFVKLIYFIWKHRKKVFRQTQLIPVLLLLIFFSVNPNWTKRQFTRNNTTVVYDRLNADGELNEEDIIVMNKNQFSLTELMQLDKVDMSGRNEIWNYFLSYSRENLAFGNYGKKAMFGKYHAHNSFIEFLASCGSILFLFFMGVIALNLTKKNIIFILPILLLGMGQYVVFWGISFFDILFYFLLFFNKKKE